MTIRIFNYGEKRPPQSVQLSVRLCEGCQDVPAEFGEFCPACAANLLEDSRKADPADSHGRP